MSACVRTPPAVAPAPAPAAGFALPSDTGAAAAAWCASCGSAVQDDAVLQAVAARIADLKARGGTCQRYADVLEGSLAANRIVVRPFMWRVGPYLASAQAKSTGEIDVAREIDALNIGRRSLDEVVHSIEHEAAHIAFGIPSGTEASEAAVEVQVGECQASGARAGQGRGRGRV